jgi:hypothetical protein
MATSDARIKANQANAARSTGPSRAGQSRSRLNAVKHGLRAETVVPPDDLEAMQRQRSAWVDDLRPVGPAQTWMVTHAAASALRVDRCLEIETAALGKRVRKAVADWTKTRRARVRKRATQLESDPAGTVARLQESAFGCDWLLARWGSLECRLSDGGGWEDDETRLALRLLGFDPADADPSEPIALAVLDAATATDQAGARAALWSLVGEQVQALGALRDALWVEVDGPLRDEAIALARFDGSPEADRMRRYEVHHTGEVHKSLRQLARLREDDDPAARHDARAAIPEWERDHRGDVPDDSPPAPAPNEPNGHPTKPCNVTTFDQSPGRSGSAPGRAEPAAMRSSGAFAAWMTRCRAQSEGIAEAAAVPAAESGPIEPGSAALA